MSPLGITLLLGAALVGSAVAGKGESKMDAKARRFSPEDIDISCEELLGDCDVTDSDCLKTNLESLFPKLNGTDKRAVYRKLMWCYENKGDSDAEDSGKPVGRRWLSRLGKSMRRRPAEGDAEGKELEKRPGVETEELDRPKMDKMGRKRGGKFGRGKGQRKEMRGEKKEGEAVPEETPTEETEEGESLVGGQDDGMKGGRHRGGRMGMGKPRKGWRKQHKHEAMKKGKEMKKQLKLQKQQQKALTKEEKEQRKKAKVQKKQEMFAAKAAHKSAKKAQRGERRQHVKSERKTQRGHWRKAGKPYTPKEDVATTPQTAVPEIIPEGGEKDLTKSMGKPIEEEMEKPEPKPAP